MRSRRSFAPVLLTPQPSVPVWRLFSDAPTVMMFFAVPGGWTVEAPGPLFPAAKTIVSSWFPAVPVSASRTAASWAWQSELYVMPLVKPH
jgi:hypothetical protein